VGKTRVEGVIHSFVSEGIIKIYIYCFFLKKTSRETFLVGPAGRVVFDWNDVIMIVIRSVRSATRYNNVPDGELIA